MIKYLIILICIPFIGSSQTTEDEFNYVTKGYQSQIDAGLDPVKKNYKIVDMPIDFVTKNGINYKFKKLIKGNDSLKCIIMIMYDGIGSDYYCCLPHPKTKPELYKKCMSNMNLPISTSSLYIARYTDLTEALLKAMNYFAYSSK